MRQRSRGQLSGSAATLLLILAAGCDGVSVAPGTAAIKGIPMDVEAIGVRAISDKPSFARPVGCKPDVPCVSADVNGDRRADLIQIDQKGILGKAGAVWVAYGNTWDFSAPEVQAWCKEGEHCTVADIEGDGLGELVSFGSKDGTVWVTELGHDVNDTKPYLWNKSFCTGDSPRCRVVDVSGDGAADLVWLTDKAIQIASHSIKDDKWAYRAIENDLCANDRRCALADIDGNLGAELVAMAYPQKQMPIQVLHLDSAKSEPETWSDIACPSAATCTLRDLNGDGRADLIERLDDQLIPYMSMDKGFEQAPAQAIPACKAGYRCWLADASADGRADLWIVDPDGLLRIFENRDAIDRMDDAAMALSILDQDYARWYEKSLEASMIALMRDALPTPADWDGYFGTSDHAWPDDVHEISEASFSAQDNAGRADINAAISEVLASIPPESALLDTATQRRWQRAAGHVIAARTSLLSGPVGASRRSSIASCGNVILHDRYIVDGEELAEGSYLARYFDSLRETAQEDRTEHAVGALAAISEGLRCLSATEIANVDTAFSLAVLDTMNDLLDAGQIVLARRMWDRSLPVVMVLFDATHHFTVPTSWRLLQARISAGEATIPDAPEPGFDFAAAAQDPDCETLWCQLYRHPMRTAMDEYVLTLDDIGLWLPNVQDENVLHRMDMLGEDLIPGMIDLNHFGEGSCQLFEVITMGMSCPTRDTCSAGDQLLATLPGPTEPTPGSFGSRWTHLFTDRMTIAASNGCGGSGGGGGGGAPIVGCGGPPVRNMAGHFSIDPEVDRLMRCAMETASGSTDVLLDMSMNADCLARQGGAPATADPPKKTTAAAEEWEDEDSQQEMLELFEDGSNDVQSTYGRNRDDMVSAIRDGAASRPGRVPTEEEVVAVMKELAPDYFGEGRWHTSENGALGVPAGTGVESGTIFYNPDLLEAESARWNTKFGMGRHEFVTRVMAHEFLHAVVNELSNRGMMDEWWTKASGHDEIHDHTHVAGPQMCGIAGGGCSNQCGLSEALAKRFTDCLSEPRSVTAEDVTCHYQVDYCTDRLHGNIGGFDLGGQCAGAPDVNINSECFAVNCAGGGAITGACCGAFATGEIPHDLFTGPDPGPMPPREDMFMATPRLWSELPFP